MLEGAASWLTGAGTLIGGLGTVYSAYNTNKQYKFANNLALQDRAIAMKKDKEAQFNLDTAVKNVYGGGEQQ